MKTDDGIIKTLQSEFEEKPAPSVIHSINASTSFQESEKDPGKMWGINADKIFEEVKTLLKVCDFPWKFCWFHFL